MRLFLFLIFYCSGFNSFATLLEKTTAQVGKSMISLIDLKTFQKRMRLNLIPDSFILDSLYKGRWTLLQKPATSNKLGPQKERALNYLILREIVRQKIKNLPLEQSLPEPEITATLKKQKGRLSSGQFLSRLKKAGFGSLLEYQIFLKEEKKMELLLMRALSPKIALFNHEIESAFFKVYKRSLFSDYEYDFLLVSFEEDQKEQVLRSLQKKSPGDLKKWAKALNLSFKNSKLKSKEIESSIRKELDKLSVSQISPLLFLSSSYYLLQLKWKEALIDPKDRNKKLKIEGNLSQKKLWRELSYWIQSEKDQFFIKIFGL